MGGLAAILEPFVWSWGALREYNREYLVNYNERIHYLHADISYHAAARNQLVDDMQGDWLLQLDTDHFFAPDIAARMLRIMNDYEIDVLSGLYQFKVPPHSPVSFMWNEQAQCFVMLGKWEGDGEILRVGGGGGGCLMVRRSVFDRIRTELNEQPFECLPMPLASPPRNFSEDQSFFVRCMRLGIGVYLAVNVRANHLRISPVTWKDYPIDQMSMSRVKMDTKELVDGKLVDAAQG